MRCGFCKRYATDGALEWVKDYTKDYMERIDDINSRRGQLKFSITEAAKLLGCTDGLIPKDASEVDRLYRKACKPLHPDKCADPDANERFIEVSRAREVLLKHFGDF